LVDLRRGFARSGFGRILLAKLYESRFYCQFQEMGAYSSNMAEYSDTYPKGAVV
jgi:hypothetical protein